MNSKERVVRAIEKRSPARLPIYYRNRDTERSDVINAVLAPAADFVPRTPGHTEWGYTWATLDQTMGQPQDRPLADEASFAAYTPPDPAAPGRMELIKQTLEAHPDRFIKVDMGITGYNQATFLRGMTAFLSDLYLRRDLAERVLDYVFDFENGIIARLEGLAVDGVGLADDWGTQKGLFIAPELWREVFKPRYAAQIELAHRLGKKVWLHSCGDLSAIIEDWIEIGLDVIELLQPDIFGVERLAARFGGRICFCCSIDHQRRAISGSRQEIFDYARLLHERLGCYQGGFIAYVEDYACLGMPEQNYQWIREAFQAMSMPGGADDSCSCSCSCS